MYSFNLKVPPLAQVVISALLLHMINFFFPKFHLQVQYSGAIAIAVFCLGVTIAVLGVATFRSHKTTVNPLTPEKSVALVRTGVYRFSRNPMYLGMLFMLTGVAVYLENLLAAVVVLPAFVLYLSKFQIVAEEGFMRERFGVEYEAYAKAVRMWL